MALTDQQRAELDAQGIRTVQLKLTSADSNSGALVKHIVSGDVLRGDIDKWVAEQTHAEAKERAETLRLAKLAHEQQIEALRWAKISGKWARIAGWAALAAVGIGIVVPLLQWLLAK